jgi:hypothetical protein
MVEVSLLSPSFSRYHIKRQTFTSRVFQEALMGKILIGVFIFYVRQILQIIIKTHEERGSKAFIKVIF